MIQKKYALITGGSRGIGRAICLQLAKNGYSILINYKGNHAAAEETAEGVKQLGQDAILLPFDVSNRQEVEDTFHQLSQDHPDLNIEVLVNNAGIRRDSLLPFMEHEQWDSVIQTNLEGMYNVTRQIIKGMVLKRYGRIINIVSLSGIKGMPGQVNYSAAKAGIIGATKALALEVAKRKITVNAIAPGFIETDMTEDLNQKELQGIIPMNRFGKAEEVADLAGFLASEKAAYITGQVISINGGLYT